MAPQSPEKGAFRVQGIEDGNVLATPTNNSNLDINPSHHHNQSKKKWEKVSARIQSLQTLNMEKPSPIIKSATATTKQEPTHTKINSSIPASP